MFSTSPDTSESYGTRSRTECNENSWGVTNILLRCNNVTKCNEKYSRAYEVCVFVTFRYIHCWGVSFVTMTAFSLHFYGRANTELSKTSGDVCSSEHIAENEVETPHLQLNRLL